ncbi:MAG: molecular chaperone GrpE [Sulfitobacter sp.]|jgi:molecular chaperone GrpE
MATPKEDNIFDEIVDAAAAEAAPQEPFIDMTQLADEPVEDEMHASITAIIDERDELKDRLLRSLAEAENIRKRGDRDRREAEQFGGTKLSRDMLPVYDNLKRALDAAGEDVSGGEKAVLDGVELTMRELLNIFSKHGITRIEPQEGDTFDPQRHQAMFEAPVPDVPKGGIIQVMTAGFLLHDRLLRPAQVGVSSQPAS